MNVIGRELIPVFSPEYRAILRQNLKIYSK